MNITIPTDELTLMLNLNGTVLTVRDFAENSKYDVTFSNDLATATLSADGGVIWKENSNAFFADIQITVQANGETDQLINAFVLQGLNGVVSATAKRIYYVDTEERQETHAINGGNFISMPVRNEEATRQYKLKAFVKVTI